MVGSTGNQLRLFISILLASFVSFPVLDGMIKPAHADGLFQEQFNASLEGRDARLSVSVNPPVLTSATQQDTFVQFRLFDAATNETIPYSTWDITIEKGVGEDSDRLLRNVFHTESGLLKLKVQPQEAETVTILGRQEDFLKAWVADPGGTINLRGPIFLEGGLYHFGIRILGIDSIRELFPEDRISSFDSWLSVGDVFSESVDYEGVAYNMTIISYYDRVDEFNFNEQNKSFNWAMPFDWNTTRIGQTSIFVHEEVKIPKSMQGIGDALSFKATVNDVPIAGSKIVVDPYTSDSELVLHYLLNKGDILSLAEKVSAEAEQMSFSFSPSSEVVEETTTEISTDTGGINVDLEWMPDPLNANTESTVKATFSDAFSGQMLDDADVIYDLRILDMNGTVVYNEAGLTANGGADTQTIDFPSNENYRIEIQVQGLAQDGGSVDKTRNGIARGLVVVPEFPVGALIAAGGVLASIVIVQRYTRTQGFKA